MPALSIITVCKGRLSHLKRSLPAMLAQQQAQIVVVDYDCPEGAADHVSLAHPGVSVVKVENRPHFNNWEARNIGARHATGDLLAFVDADVILADGFCNWCLQNIAPGNFGKMPTAVAQSIHADEKLNAGSNRLEGLLVVPRKTFVALGGYDDLLEGWGAGGDVDLNDRLGMSGNRMVVMPETLVSETIRHSDEERVRFHRMNVGASHLTGLLYRMSKNSLTRLFAKPLPLSERKRLYELVRKSVAAADANSARTQLLVVSTEVPGSNFKVEQTITTTVTWKP